ncbi:MAG: hypothetical protein XE02_0676 [Mesotoga infera]|uniref:Uncharacterized protein n=1 Tax=Mesotoga infera TaxID=1236046 RepID=A0A101I886_9BACT|nr:MAG: hypothetical protein XE02_0676 [Mesotoga infera]
MVLLTQVEERHPLKQGLKPFANCKGNKQALRVEERHPLKQGLKLKYFQNIVFFFQVEERHPLKQGLKQ